MLQLGYHCQSMQDLVQIPGNADLFTIRYYEVGTLGLNHRWALYLKHIKPSKRYSSKYMVAMGDLERPPTHFTVLVPRHWLPPGWQESVARAKIDLDRAVKLETLLQKHRLKKTLR